MTKVKIKKASAEIVEAEFYTSGMVGAEIAFQFSEEWNGLSKTAVFKAGNVQKDVLNVTDVCTIPHEVLASAGERLIVGVYGTNGNDVVIPTVYANLGRIKQGADPSGDESAEPSLPVWAQLQALIGNLDDLETTAKNNLVAAINEAAQTGGGGSAILAMRVSGGYIQYTTDNVTWVNLIAVADLKGAKGDKGDKGDTGAQGAQGIQGEQGIQGIQGIQGVKGDKGDKGDAYTLTDADKQTIVTAVVDALPKYNGGVT